MFAPVFVDETSWNTISLQKLRLVNAPGQGEEVLQLINEKGYYVDVYTWYGKEFCQEYDLPGAGWYNSEGEQVSENVTLGTAIYVNVGDPITNADKIHVQVAGNVKLESTKVSIETGYNIVGNCSPVNVPLQSIKLLGAPGQGDEVIQLINEQGYYVDVYTWYGEEFCKEYDLPGAGWYNSDGEQVEENVVSGKGIYVNVLSPAEIEIPAVK